MATIPSSYLVDTNVLLRYANRSQPLHGQVTQCVNRLLGYGHQLYMSSQNCIEFWNVATRPASRNGFGFLSEDVDVTLGWLERAFPLLADVPAIYTEWRELVTKFGVSGVQVHDARLVAIMRVNQISHLLTFNTKDFTRYRSQSRNR